MYHSLLRWYIIHLLPNFCPYVLHTYLGCYVFICTLYNPLIQVPALPAKVITDLESWNEAVLQVKLKGLRCLFKIGIYRLNRRKPSTLFTKLWRRSIWNTPEHPAMTSQHRAFFARVLWQITAFWNLWKWCLPLRQPQSPRHSKSRPPSTLLWRLCHRSAPSSSLPASLSVHDPKACRCIVLPLRSFQAWSCRELGSRGTRAFVPEHFEITPRKVERLLVAHRGRAILLNPRSNSQPTPARDISQTMRLRPMRS